MKIARFVLFWAFAALALLPLGQAQDAPKPFSKEELEQLTAPIALYPDALVAQILMASTYPLEVVEAARWSKANPNLKDKALEDVLQKQSWDPSVKSLTAFPKVLAGMNEKLDVTQKLGDAFLGQQKEVMDAIQRLRGKADQAGNLKSSKEQTVSKGQEAGQTVIKIEPADPQVVYVPTYNPTVVYGAWPYPAYPPYYYYPYPPGAAVFSFAVGVAVGSALWGNCNWGHGDVNINVNKYNNFNKTNIQNNNWQHNADHRKGVGYRDQASQQKFGKGQQRAGADSREAFRGRADGFKGGAGDRAGGRDGGIGGKRGAGDRQDGMGDRGGGGLGDHGGGMQHAGGRSAGGFDGIESGHQTRDFSSRGAASRGGMGGHRGGGGRRR